MPASFHQYVEDTDNPLVLDLSDAGARLSASFQHQQEAFETCRRFRKDLIDARTDLERNKGNASEWISTLKGHLVAAIRGSSPSSLSRSGTKPAPVVTADGKPDYKEEDTTGRVPRIAYINQRIEELVQFMAMHHFLETGKMIPPSACSFFVDKSNDDDDNNNDNNINNDDDDGSNDKQKYFAPTDEEYLLGVMGFAQDLSRYAMGRATARDAQSVRQARDLVDYTLEYLLRFDFRNGFLRRKYDGTKYALKAVETLLYELSNTGASLEEIGEEPRGKKPRLEESSSKEDGPSPPSVETTPSLEEELEALRLRMEQRDKVRETLIKQSRDGQKAAKQAIYALHRNDFSKAARLIKSCEDCINQKLLPLVKEEPPLRQGSFANVLEEYAEAKLFYVWLLGDGEIHGNGGGNGDGDGDTEDTAMTTTTDAAAAGGKLLLPTEFPNVPCLDLDDYLGGLCDLTGEIGRYAVRKGTVRDMKGVYQCLEANTAIMKAVQTIERSPKGIDKKTFTLRQSVSKIERMIYEMSLSEAAGMKFKSSLEDNTEDSTKNNNREE